MMIQGFTSFSFQSPFGSPRALNSSPIAISGPEVPRETAATSPAKTSDEDNRPEQAAPVSGPPAVSSSARQNGSGTELDEAQIRELTELKARDREVRAHEMAHQAVGGQYAGSASYTYQSGPDGVQYAVGGEVPISVSPIAGDPQATIEKMRVVRAAALAPAEPSSQDRAVAAEATQIMLKAQIDMSEAARAPEARDSLSNDQRLVTTPGRKASQTYHSVFMSDGSLGYGPALRRTGGFQASA